MWKPCVQAVHKAEEHAQMKEEKALRFCRTEFWSSCNIVMQALWEQESCQSLRLLHLSLGFHRQLHEIVFDAGQYDHDWSQHVGFRKL